MRAALRSRACGDNGEIRYLERAPTRGGEGDTSKSTSTGIGETSEHAVIREEQVQDAQVAGYEWEVGEGVGLMGREAQLWGAERANFGAAQDDGTVRVARSKSIASLFLQAGGFDDARCCFVFAPCPTSPICCKCCASAERFHRSSREEG